MQLNEKIYMVASGALGLNFSNKTDCNAYLVDCGQEEWALIDTGTGLDPEDLIDRIKKCLPHHSSPRHLLITHGHLDHSGATHFLKKHYQLQVYAHERTVSMLQAGDEKGISLSLAKKAGLYPEDIFFEPCDIDHVLTDQSVFQIGDVNITTIEAPGHSHDMTAYLFEHPAGRWLFAGDSVFPEGKILISATYDCDLQAYIKTINKLGDLTFNALLAGHGKPVLHEADKHTMKAADSLKKLLLPDNLI